MAACGCFMQLHVSGSMFAVTLPRTIYASSLRTHRSRAHRLQNLTGQRFCSGTAFLSEPQLQRHSTQRGASMSCRAFQEAIWPDQGPPDAAFSVLIRQEILLFLFQVNYDRRLQRALNYEDNDSVTKLREQIENLDQMVERFQSAVKKRNGNSRRHTVVQAEKGPGDGSRASKHQEMAGFASEGLRLRTELQRAVDEERYEDAAKLKVRLGDLTKEAEAAAAKAAEERSGSNNRAFRLGQRVVHARDSYRAVVCGWDVRCCENEAWQESMGVKDLQRGDRQPWYHLLVDLRDWAAVSAEYAIAYVPEELLREPTPEEQLPDDAAVDEATDAEMKLTPGLAHPFGSLMFLGADNLGDMVPSRALRRKYSAPRRDVRPPEAKENDIGEGASSSSTPEGFDADSPSGPENLTPESEGGDADGSGFL